MLLIYQKGEKLVENFAKVTNIEEVMNEIISQASLLLKNGLVLLDIRIDNILIQPLRLANYGLYYMTDCGKEIDFYPE